MSKYSDIKRLKEDIRYAKILLEWYHPQQDKEKYEYWTEKVKDYEKELYKLVEESE